MKQTARPELAAWLLDPARPLPPTSLLRGARLAAYAYTTLPPEAPERTELRGDYLASLARHQRIRSELAPLLAAWSDAGIRVLLFKGFHLAEFVYPVPGARFHGDVDILVRPEDAERASRIAARERGWREEANTVELGRPFTHNVCSLYGPGDAACVDLHRWALHSPLPWNRVQRRVTEAVWARSRQREWEGVPVREMDPVDALLVGLVLQRCWGDRWHLKPHDVLDFRLLCERCGIGREEVWERARELGATRTLGLFLERCDPWEGVLDLAPPTPAALRRWDRAAFPERGPLGRSQRALGRLHALPETAVDVLAAVPAVREARRALGRGLGIHELLRALTPAALPHTQGTVKRRWRTVQGIRWAVRLLPGRNPRGDCLVRSLAIYAVLRRQGWPVTFVSGVRRDADGVVGHAWVELEGRVLRELGEPRNRELYAVNLEYPAGES